MSIYNDRRWRRESRAHRKKYPLCWYCDKKGREGPAELVDHAIRVQDGGAFMNPMNWRSSCEHCHAIKRGAEKNGWTEESEYHEGWPEVEDSAGLIPLDRRGYETT